MISTIVPTYARPEHLRDCLEALACQEHPRQDYEVVVVDDGSPESPVTIVADFERRMDVSLLVQENAGPAAARNAGAARARGALLAFTDDDCRPEPGWLAALARAHAAAPDRLLGGTTDNALADDLYAATSQMLIDHLYEYFNADPDDCRLFTSNNFAVPTGAFHELGGFAGEFPLAGGEDRELCDRWVASGRRMRFVPEAVVQHFHGMTLRAFARQHFGYGRGGYVFHRRRSGREPLRVEPLSFYAGLVAHPFRRRAAAGWRAVGATLLMLLSQVANVSGFFYEAWRQRRAKRALAAEPSGSR